MASISIDTLSKSFGDGEIVAVDDLSIEIRDGEFLVIVGPSGCGKTTTLNCIAGLETPTSGHIFIDDEDITHLSPQKRDIAMVFQNYALYPHMNARKNIAFGLRMRSTMSKAEVNERVDEVAELLEISELLDQRPRSLSGGQQQRVALGRAIARDPEVFLMDEPLSNLDAKLRRQMRAELQNLQDQLGVTTVYVTHDQSEAMTMGDRVVILDGGELQQIGTPLECYHEPVNEFVAGFLGEPSMNFVDVAFADDRFQHPEFTYPLSEEVVERLADAPEALHLGVRPEDVEVSSAPVDGAIEASVSVVEPMGDVTHLFVEFDETQQIASVEGSLLAESGDTVYLSYPEDKIHVFEAGTGETLLNRIAPYEGTEVASSV